MKKIISLLVLLGILLTFPLCYATPFPNKNDPNSVKWTYCEAEKNTTYYFAPSLTTIAPDGTLEAWIKISEIDFDGNQFNTLKHIFTNQSFEKIRTAEVIEYNNLNHIKADRDYSTDTKWNDMPLGTALESALLDAEQYAQNLPKK